MIALLDPALEPSASMPQSPSTISATSVVARTILGASGRRPFLFAP